MLAQTFAHSASAQNYTLTDLGIPGNVPGSAAEAHGINGAGAVVGTWWDGATAKGSQYVFLYAHGTNTNLGTIKAGGYDYATGSGVNLANQVVGQGTTGGGGGYIYHAFLWTNGVMTDLDNTGQSWSGATAINEAGQVVGFFTTPTNSSVTHAFLYTNGLFQDLGTLGGTYSSANGINDSGAIVGESTDTNGNTLAFLYRNGFMTNLGTLGGAYSSAKAINNSGVIVGESSLVGGEIQGFIYSNGVMAALGTFGGTNSTATAINNGGEVVGYALTTDEQAHGFLFSGTGLIDLQTCFSPPAPWTNVFLTLAYAINDAGQIAGAVNYVANGSTNYDAFLLTPPPLTLTWPSNITVSAPNLAGAVVFFNASAVGGCSGASVTSIPASGSLFPIGANTVTAIASDLCGHTSTGTFTVTVRPPVFVSDPRISAGNRLQITVGGVAGQRFAIQASSNLTEWTSIFTNILTVSPTNFVDSSPATNRCRYFRAIPIP